MEDDIFGLGGPWGALGGPWGALGGLGGPLGGPPRVLGGSWGASLHLAPPHFVALDNGFEPQVRLRGVERCLLPII